jgi:hypothetical protein
MVVDAHAHTHTRTLVSQTRKAKETPRVLLVITAEGISVEIHPDELKKEKDKGTTSTSMQNKHLAQIPIRNISFSGVDMEDKQLFAFIATDPKTQLMNCHIFQMEGKANLVADGVTQAFNLAQQLRADPFAIERKGVPTPGAFDADFQGFIIPRQELKAKMIIGHGQYGKVYLAERGSTQLAVKLMRVTSNSVDEEEFVGEARLMRNFQHINCLGVSALGGCLTL